MGYYSDDMTDEELAKLEKRIARAYRRAYIEMYAKAENYFDTLNEERIQKEYEAYQRGEYTKSEFDLWYQTQVMRGQGYEQMRDALANQMADANKIASAYINDTTPSIASLNYNYEAYEIAQAHGIDFHLADAQTIKELMSEANHVEFRTVKTNPTRDYLWNRGQINSILTSAIIQGKSIDKLADSFLIVMKRNRASAIRNARTAVTSAQNGGRQASYEQATKMGIKIEKEWIATLDERTRISHAMRDGKRVPYDKEFADGLMYPADSNGVPAEVYNCRCTMRAVLPNINDEKRETYADWLERMAGEDGLSPEIKNAIKRWKESKMASRINIDDYPPIKHTPEELQAIKEYAKSKGIMTANMHMFDGDTEILKEQIDILAEYKNRFKLKKVGISFSRSLSDDTPAWTPNDHVIFNTKFLRSRKATESFLNADSTLSATNIRGLGAHEVMHLFMRQYGYKGIEIAQKAYYNLYGSELTRGEILKYLKNNVSSYSASADEMSKHIRYKELLPEISAKNETNPDRFTEEYMRIVLESIK